MVRYFCPSWEHACCGNPRQPCQSAAARPGKRDVHHNLNDSLILCLGRTKFSRLYLIGTCSTYLSAEALKLAVTEARSGKDVNNYQKAVEALARVAPSESEATLDTTWIEQTLKNVKADTDRLEHELKGYKNNLIKESIRVSQVLLLPVYAENSRVSIDG